MTASAVFVEPTQHRVHALSAGEVQGIEFCATLGPTMHPASYRTRTACLRAWSVVGEVQVVVVRCR